MQQMPLHSSEHHIRTERKTCSLSHYFLHVFFLLLKGLSVLNYVLYLKPKQLKYQSEWKTHWIILKLQVNLLNQIGLESTFHVHSTSALQYM